MTKVLDHGEVILVDSMAADVKVVAAARVSTGKEPVRYTEADEGFYRANPDYQGEPIVVSTEEKDRKLINYLMSNGHGTPFEHAVFQFFIKCPIFVAREWQRHRIASYNEFSLRYAEVGTEQNEAEFYVPATVRVPDPKNKQSSVPHRPDVESGFSPFTYEVQEQIAGQNQVALEKYRMLLGVGVAREMARMVLPVNIYTKFWFTVNARSLMNFLMLRNHPNAQWEIQEFAKALELDFANAMPWTHTAFVDTGRRAP